jgi:hypothetical protein
MIIRFIITKLYFIQILIAYLDENSQLIKQIKMKQLTILLLMLFSFVNLYADDGVAYDLNVDGLITVIVFVNIIFANTDMSLKKRLFLKLMNKLKNETSINIFNYKCKCTCSE